MVSLTSTALSTLRDLETEVVCREPRPELWRVATRQFVSDFHAGNAVFKSPLIDKGGD